MADVAENLRAFLLADATIAGLVGERCAQGHVPQDAALPYLWFRQRGVNYERTTDSAAGEQPTDYLYDLEIVAADVDAMARLAARVRERLNCHRGSFGDQTVQAVFVEDHDEDYQPRNQDEDGGLHIAALDVQVSPNP